MNNNEALLFCSIISVIWNLTKHKMTMLKSNIANTVSSYSVICLPSSAVGACLFFLCVLAVFFGHDVLLADSEETLSGQHAGT